MRPDKIRRTDALNGMKALPDACIPMTLTSPPYDDMFVFGGHRWDFKTFRSIAAELWRVTMPGGVVCWVVGDQVTREGGETGTGFRHALRFKKLGFRLHQTLIMCKTNGRTPWKDRYGRVEFCFVLSKGRPRAFTPLLKPNRKAGTGEPFVRRTREGLRENAGGICQIKPFGKRLAVWCYNTGFNHTTSERCVLKAHPSLMPEPMARDLILSWSRPGDLILDPMGGAGTTAKMALLTDRRYLLFEPHKPYVRDAEDRLRRAQAEYRTGLDDWLYNL